MKLIALEPQACTVPDTLQIVGVLIDGKEYPMKRPVTVRKGDPMPILEFDDDGTCQFVDESHPFWSGEC